MRGRLEEADKEESIRVRVLVEIVWRRADVIKGAGGGSYRSIVVSISLRSILYLNLVAAVVRQICNME